MKRQKATPQARLVIALATVLFWWFLELLTLSVGTLPNPSRWLG